MSKATFFRAGCVIVSAVLAFGVGACAPKKGDTAGHGDTIRIAAIASGPFTKQFNPLLESSKSGAGYSSLLMFEPLMMNDLQRGTPAPWLASSYKWSTDGKSLSIQIHPGVRWSDGTPLTADDVAFTFSLMQKHAVLNFYSLPIAGASAPAADTAVVTFSKPAFQYEWWDTAPVPKHLWQSIPDPTTYADPQPVGSGPYILKSFTPQAITLERNPSYWGTAPKMQTVQYLSYDSASSMVAALRAGQVDWITTQQSDPARIADLAPSQIGYWASSLSPTTIFMMPNDHQSPTDQAPVRLAISEAIDRGAVSKLAFGGQNGPVDSPTGLSLRTYSSLVAPQYRSLTFGAGDAAQAKKTLTTAGYRIGGDGIFTAPDGSRLSLTITVPSESTYGDLVRAATVIGQQLKAAGIATTVKSESAAAWRKDTALGDFQLTLRGLGGNLAVYTLFNSFFAQPIKPIGKTALQNFGRYQNQQAQPLLDQWASAAPGSADEAASAAGLEQLMVTDAPIIPLFHVTYVGMWRQDRFTGFPGNTNPYALPIGSHANALKVILAIHPA